jgi:NAD(P)-dependent dehydrogenase (short-subunit alcohol dehydrogenase family)
MAGMNGKVAIVTGGGSGLGEAIGKALALRGAKVVLTKNAAAEYGPQGLRINCVGPAYIETPLLSDLPAESKRRSSHGIHSAGSDGLTKSHRWCVSFCQRRHRS